VSQETPESKSATPSDASAMLSVFEKLETDLVSAFPKMYSAARLENVLARVNSAKDGIEAIYDEARREEDPARKSGVIQRMVLGGRELSEAQAAVEAGER
jgi:hypothetical protein